MTLALVIAFIVGTLAYLGDYSHRKLVSKRLREYTVKELTGKDSSSTEEVLASIKLNDLACERSITKHIPELFQRTQGEMVRAIVKDSNGKADICFVGRSGRILPDAMCSSPGHYWGGNEKFVCQVH